jgi:hypothetical protein
MVEKIIALFLESNTLIRHKIPDIITGKNNSSVI